MLPRGRGGPSTIDNCRLTCAAHNQLAARQVCGDDWMYRFTNRTGSDIPPGVPIAREAEAPAWAPAFRTVANGNGPGRRCAPRPGWILASFVALRRERLPIADTARRR